ncbi:Otogelin-like protein [Portunus trituberculatus]|uniref:Otogelin-like protein n=1 Tax=Portunus trituberculatus TaxID=210409 RepID=A0A5B7EY84_PORTR|nr:Otogelin-like protein [Portunus trituberculatus]
MMGIKMHAVVVLLSIAAIASCRSIDGEGSGRPCAFGDRMVKDCEIAATMAEKCLMMVCRDGTIVEEMVGGPMDTGCCLGFGNVLYSNGHQTEHCMPMTCKDSVWVPEESIPQCCAQCRVYSYSHYTTFDGHHYDWQGICNYTMVEQSHSTEGHGAAVFVEMDRVGKCATTNYHTTFRNDHLTIVNITKVSALDENMTMDVNGEMMTVPDQGVRFLVSTTGNRTVMVYRRNKCIFLLGSSMLTLVHCPMSLDIMAPRMLSGSLSGLCGAFNYDDMDDFTTPVGEVQPLEMFPEDFPEMWRAEAQTMPMCMQDGVSTSICNGTKGNKCLADSDALEEYKTTCQNVLQQYISMRPELYFYVASCVNDLCLAGQGDLGTVTSMTPDPIFAATTPAGMVEVILRNYITVAGQHFQYLQRMPPLSDLSACTAPVNTTSIPVVDDSSASHDSAGHAN